MLIYNDISLEEDLSPLFASLLKLGLLHSQLREEKQKNIVSNQNKAPD